MTKSVLGIGQTERKIVNTKDWVAVGNHGIVQDAVVPTRPRISGYLFEHLRAILWPNLALALRSFFGMRHLGRVNVDCPFGNDVMHDTLTSLRDYSQGDECSGNFSLAMTRKSRQVDVNANGIDDSSLSLDRKDRFAVTQELVCPSNEQTEARQEVNAQDETPHIRNSKRSGEKHQRPKSMVSRRSLNVRIVDLFAACGIKADGCR